MHPFSVPQPAALATFHPRPAPSLPHSYSRWPEDGTAIKTNSLDQVLHFSLSEQSGRMRGDKDDCNHPPCRPVPWKESCRAVGRTTPVPMQSWYRPGTAWAASSSPGKDGVGVSVHSGHTDLWSAALPCNHHA